MLPNENIIDESGQLVTNRVVNKHRKECCGGSLTPQLDGRPPGSLVRACTGCGNRFDINYVAPGSYA